MTGCSGNAFWVCLFDERGEPTGVWTGKAMMTEATGINHRAIYLYPTEDEAWRVVERHHKPGQIWGVLSTEKLARKLKSGGL